MGMLVPPAIFMIVMAQVTNTSAVALFVAGFVPALVIMVCLMGVVYIRARQNDWPVDTRPSLKRLGHALLHAAVPMVVPFVILAGFILGIITATEAGAVVAGYAFLAAKLYYRNVSWREMGQIAYDSAILTAAVVFLLAVASVYQYLMGVSGVPQLLGQMLAPLKNHPWLFLIGTAAMSCLFGMVLEGLPAAVVLIPVVFPISEAMGIDPTNASLIIERLHSRGLVERRVKETDRRANALYLTTKGKALWRRLRPKTSAANERLLAPLTQAERELFLDLLILLIEGNRTHARPGAGRRKRRSHSPNSEAIE